MEFLLTHGYLAFFFWILANRIGAPLPATPVLLAAGALSGMGELKFVSVVALAVLATLMSDTVWFALGRRHGSRMLKLLCRLALQPDSVAHRAQDLVHRHGTRFLLVAKFIPGMNRASLPLTGSSRVSYPRFLAYDFVGATFWVCGYLGLGYVFSEQLHRLAAVAPTFGALTAAFAILLIAVYVAIRYFKRPRHIAPALEPTTPPENS
jgi:membrane protein DedA with SNARE-associated domain